MMRKCKHSEKLPRNILVTFPENSSCDYFRDIFFLPTNNFFSFCEACIKSIEDDKFCKKKTDAEPFVEKLIVSSDGCFCEETDT